VKGEEFQKIEYRVDPSKAEGISIDHLTKNIETTQNSKFSDNITSTANALKIYKEKI